MPGLKITSTGIQRLRDIATAIETGYPVEVASTEAPALGVEAFEALAARQALPSKVPAAVQPSQRKADAEFLRKLSGVLDTERG